MTVHLPKLLTPEEFASLIEIAIASDNPTIPPQHLSKLISLGYLVETAGNRRNRRRPDSHHRKRIGPR